MRVRTRVRPDTMNEAITCQSTLQVAPATCVACADPPCAATPAHLPVKCAIWMSCIQCVASVTASERVRNFSTSIVAVAARILSCVKRAPCIKRTTHSLPSYFDDEPSKTVPYARHSVPLPAACVEAEANVVPR